MKYIKGDCLSPTWNDLVRFRTKFFSNLEISGNIEITLYNETSVYKAHDHCGSFFINPSEIRLASDYKEKMPEVIILKYYFQYIIFSINFRFKRN